MIPAIEAGWVEQIHCFGSEVGMDDYIEARSDIFFTGPDGSLRSNRAFCQTAGLYACDMFIGSTLQIDLNGNSSTVTTSRIAGFGGAPNMGSDARGRRHPSEPWLQAGVEADPDGAPALRRGRKLVVQIGETFGEENVPTFVEKLDALALAEKLKLDLAPVMIYADDVSHIVTEEGIANLLLCRDKDEREQAVRGVAGYTEVGRGRDKKMVQRLRERGVIKRPEDLGVNVLDADHPACLPRDPSRISRAGRVASTSRRRNSETGEDAEHGKTDIPSYDRNQVRRRDARAGDRWRRRFRQP